MDRLKRIVHFSSPFPERLQIAFFEPQCLPAGMSNSIFQKEILLDLTNYRCPECPGFDFEASEFIPIQCEEQLLGHVLIECQDCGWNWNTGYFFSEQQYGELVEQRYTVWPAVR